MPETILGSVDLITLPPLPQLLAKFLLLAEDEQPKLPELSALISLDAAFTAQILTVSSTCLQTKISSVANIEESLAAIGMPLVRTIAGCLSSQSGHSLAIYDRNIDQASFWHHSLLVAALAKALAEASGYQDPGEAYLAGLLHDLGQPLLIGGIAEYYHHCAEPAGQTQNPSALTQALTGIDHTQFAVRLIDRWQLPSFLADAVLSHQCTADQIKQTDLLCRTLWAAHCISTHGRDIEATAATNRDIAVIIDILDTDPATLARIARTAFTWAAERAASFGIDIPPKSTAEQPRAFIYPYLSLPKQSASDAAKWQLEAMNRNRAVLQPLQQNLLDFAGEADFVAAMRESARLLFGLRPPVFLYPLADRPMFAVTDSPGQPHLLSKLEIPRDRALSLPALALETQQSVSSFSADITAPSLADVRLARQLATPGLLCVPMGSNSQQSGVLVFGLSNEQYAGKLGLLSAMEHFARSAANALASFRTLRQREQELTATLTRSFEQKARKVIHEAVNPLGIINNYLNILTEKLGSVHDGHQELLILKEEIVRVERIIRRLNDLPELSAAVETVNVNSLIEGMLALYGESLFEASNITVAKDLAPEQPLVRADRDSLKQILVNIWKNSAEAMPGGGSFTIATKMLPQGDDNGLVEIRLSDTGPGIPDDIKERLFQPLEPDRRPENSGLGLSIVDSLVNRLGGQITCNSSPGQGTVFTILLALVQKEIA